MKKRLLFLINLFWVVCLFYGHDAVSVLFLSSYNASFPTYPEQYKGIKNLFDRSDANIELYVEFLDSKRFSSDENKEELYRSMKYKIENSHPYDYVISADDNALRFVVEYQNALFPDTPVVFFGVNNQELAKEQSRNPLITGFIEEISYKDSLEVIAKLLPDAKELYILYDATASGTGDYITVESVNKRNSRFNFRALNLAEMSFEELYYTISRFDKNQPILLLSAFGDKDGRILSFSNSVAHLVKHSGAPIFHLWSHGIGDGLIGGKVVDHRYYAEMSARLVLELINGGNILDYPVSETALNRYLFDETVLRQFGIKTSRLPKGADLIKRNRIISEEMIWAFVILISVIAVLSLFLAIIMNLYRTRRRAEQQYRAMFYENRIPILITNPESGEIVNYNNAADVYYNLESKHFLKDIQIEDLPPVVHDSYDYTIQKHRDRSGKIRTVEIFNNTFQIEKAEFRINVIHDISEKEDLRVQLNRAVKMDLVGKIASGIAHDFNNYLQGIIGYSGLLLAKEGNKDIIQYLNKILDLGTTASRLSKQLLSISKDEKMEMEVINLSELIKDVVDFLSHSIKKEISISKNVENDSCRILGNYGDLQNAFINMGLNAADAVDPDGHIEFKLSKDLSQGRVLCSIIDNGVGIPHGNLEKIFDPFFTTKQNGKGTGLGLSSVFQIIEKHNGRINVSSVENVGTEFTILFPVERSKKGSVNFSSSNVV